LGAIPVVDGDRVGVRHELHRNAVDHFAGGEIDDDLIWVVTIQIRLTRDIRVDTLLVAYLGSIDIESRISRIADVLVAAFDAICPRLALITRWN
jgi:hypothetical protein